VLKLPSAFVCTREKFCQVLPPSALNAAYIGADSIPELLYVRLPEISTFGLLALAEVVTDISSVGHAEGSGRGVGSGVEVGCEVEVGGGVESSN
jgi:hypothetical protein